MRVLEALALLLIFQCAGELLVRYSGLPVPGAVIGMLLLFAWLCWHGSIPRSLEHGAGFLVRHLALFFLPAGTGIFFLPAALNEQLPALLTALIVSTLLTLLLTGWLMQTLDSKRRGRGR